MKEKAKARLRELTKDHMIFDLIDLFDQKQGVWTGGHNGT